LNDASIPCVVDTNVLVYELLRIPGVERFAPYLSNSLAIISFQTVGELRHIALRRDWGRRRLSAMEALIRSFTVLTATDEITHRWARLMHEQARVGRRIEIADAWIAATALHLNIPLVTNDRSVFEHVSGLTVRP
jgi:predicted nucleic acid-binding protein